MPASIIFFGSGDFGLPTLKRLNDLGRVRMVVSQPDRNAGRGRHLTPTPVSAFALDQGIPLLRPENVNTDDHVTRIRSIDAAIFVVIAFGQKLRPPLLADRFAINLHGSLLPRHRGAAPVQWSILSGDANAGLSVITLAQKMDAGDILADWPTPIGDTETAAELHQRLAAAGPDLIESVLARFETNTLNPRRQDESLATHAAKISRHDTSLDFHQPAFRIQRRIHALSPRPGCTVLIDGHQVKLLRVRILSGDSTPPGSFRPDHAIACADDAILPIDVQPAGRSSMPWDSYLRGHPVIPGTLCTPCHAEASS